MDEVDVVVLVLVVEVAVVVDSAVAVVDTEDLAKRKPSPLTRSTCNVYI